jgi:hypothetical protein
MAEDRPLALATLHRETDPDRLYGVVATAKATTVMTADPHLIERTSDLKRELIDFSHQRRFERAARTAVKERYGRFPVLDEEEAINFQDWFALQARLPDGRTVVEHFVDAYPDLTEEERAMLLGWRDVVDGLFEVKRRDGEAVLLHNLVDDLTYRAHANVGPAIFRQMPRGSFLVARLVPLGDEWLLSGASTLLPAAGRAEVYQMAVELSTRFPAMVFRNPDKLAQAWKLQREERRHFIDFFGSDLVILPGREIAARMRAYNYYRTYEARDAEGKTVVERAKEARDLEPPEVDLPLPDDFAAAETIGMIYGEEEGLTFYVNLGTVAETFANPELAAERKHRRAVLNYLKDESISPLPFRRLAAADPERASQVFQRLLKQPRFSWERDGEELLRKHKASFVDKPVLPSVLPLSDRLARATLTAPETAGPHSDYQPMPYRKKGSWKPARRRR